jgi:hypothetical protein
MFSQYSNKFPQLRTYYFYYIIHPGDSAKLKTMSISRPCFFFCIEEFINEKRRWNLTLYPFFCDPGCQVGFSIRLSACFELGRPTLNTSGRVCRKEERRIQDSLLRNFNVPNYFIVFMNIDAFMFVHLLVTEYQVKMHGESNIKSVS